MILTPSLADKYILFVLLFDVSEIILRIISSISIKGGCINGAVVTFRDWVEFFLVVVVVATGTVVILDLVLPATDVRRAFDFDGGVFGFVVLGFFVDEGGGAGDDFLFFDADVVVVLLEGEEDAAAAVVLRLVGVDGDAAVPVLFRFAVVAAAFFFAVVVVVVFFAVGVVVVLFFAVGVVGAFFFAVGVALVAVAVISCFFLRLFIVMRPIIEPGTFSVVICKP